MFGIPSLSGLAIKALIAIAVLAVAFAAGWRVDNWRWEAKQVAVQIEVQAEKDALVKKANDAEAALVALQNQRQVNNRETEKQVEKVVTRTVYANVCLDSDGLRLVQSALANKAPGPSKPN